jgi:DNA-binding NarL/FixJ family response regulator
VEQHVSQPQSCADGQRGELYTYAHAAIRAGASGFLLKDAQPADLLSAIRAVASGDAVVAPSTTRRLLATLADRIPARAAPDEWAAIVPALPEVRLTGCR